VRRILMLCLTATFAAGCSSEKKPTEPSAPAVQPPQPPPAGKKQTGPGFSRLLIPACDVPCG
jgi:hypothetical protein